MSKFEVRIREVGEVRNHPDADRLSLNTIDGFTTVSAKLEDGSHRYKSGDLVVYIPENALVPEYLLRKGFWNEEKGIGYLAGPLGNRVKPSKLRGILSEGILYSVNTFDGFDPENHFALVHSHPDLNIEIGMDVAELLGIVKWEPEIPASMSGDVFNASGLTLKYDFENIQKYPDILQEGEEIVATEKLHGTFVQIGVFPEGTDENLIDGRYLVTSKGLAAKGLAFKDTPENRTENLYVRTFLAMKDEFDKAYFNPESFFKFPDDTKLHFVGEIYGKGVQDMNYNVGVPKFALFDVFQDGMPYDYGLMLHLAKMMNIETVPHVYHGPYSAEKVLELREGTTLVNGAHIREGVVIKPVVERRYENGRVQFKAINPKYITRKGNHTEYQ